MIAFLIGAGVISYAVLYSGIAGLKGTPISTLAALRGGISLSSKQPTTPGATGGSRPSGGIVRRA